MIWFGNFTHRLPCQRCHLSNICFFQNERTYLLIRHVFTRHYYVGNKVLVIKEHVFRKYPINSLIFHCLTCNSVCAFGVLLSAKKCLCNGFTQEVLRDKAGTIVFSERSGTFPWHTPMYHLWLHYPYGKAVAVLPDAGQFENTVPWQRPDCLQDRWTTEKRS